MWTSDKPLFIKGGRILDLVTADIITASRASAIRDVPGKERLCASLDIRSAPLANEGFATYSFPRLRMLATLKNARDSETLPTEPHSWHILSSQKAAIDTLPSVGSDAGLFGPTSMLAGYIAFFDAE
ncbi:hypothetical protein [Paraburkholderia caribensis]|uniref:hypothetical protein n=1 Tax=Paraburkholderia caribensis TaxID=75105 RepID=UPI001CC42B40|nr:hypothetical protein [Paraburkholderia caribensis]BEU25602.1 hypothetical protein PBP221_57420 [Paraburkholderia sp. 22B1P]